MPLKPLLVVLGKVSAHGHDHGYGSNAGEKYEHLFAPIFVFKDPLVNAALAVGLITALTQIVLWHLPRLDGSTLAFLVAFAAGGMLGNVFLHLLPEAAAVSSGFGSQTAMAFAALAVVDKTLRLIVSCLGTQSNSQSNVHSHSHSHDHPPRDLDEHYSHSDLGAASARQQNLPDSLRSRHSVQSDRLGLPEAGAKVREEARPSHDNTASFINAGVVAAILNVIVDMLHNVADGVALASAFRTSPSIGARAFAIMACHEIPHQLGDFALVLWAGQSRGTGMLAQLVTAAGTLIGCYMAQGADDKLAPITAGLVLYVATVGVLPEILEEEADGSYSVKHRLCRSAIQAIGITTGVGIMALLS